MKIKKYIISLVVVLFNICIGFSQDTIAVKETVSKWEKSIAAYEKGDVTNPPPQGGIEFVGSSTIKKWITLENDFKGFPVFNRGFGGSQISDSKKFANRIIIPYAPKMIFFHAGDNDLASGKNPEQVFSDFKDLVATIHAKLPKTAVFFISLKPSEKRWKLRFDEQKVNQYIQELVKSDPRIHYIDTYDMVINPEGKPRPELFAADQLHLNAAGYQLLVELILPFLDDEISKPTPIKKKKHNSN